MALTGEDITLRDTDHPPYTNKADELSYSEMDGNIIALGDAVLALQSAGAVTAYSDSTTYSSGQYATADSKLWRYINGTPSSGNDPEEGTYWTLASPGELAHEQNKDTQMAVPSGGGFSATTVGSRDIWHVVQTGLKYKKTSLTFDQIRGLSGTSVSLIPAPGAGKILVPHSISARLNYSGPIYENVPINIKIDTAGGKVFYSQCLLISVNDRMINLQRHDIEPADDTTTQFVANKALVVYCDDNPGSDGMSTIDFYIIYSEITL